MKRTFGHIVLGTTLTLTLVSAFAPRAAAASKLKRAIEEKTRAVISTKTDAPTPPGPHATTCSYSFEVLDPLLFMADGGRGSIGVRTASDCAWTVTITQNWARITQNSGHGTGPGWVYFTVDPNLDLSRSAQLTLTGQDSSLLTYFINQRGAGLPPPTLGFSGNPWAMESNGAAQVTVARGGNPNIRVTVDYATSDGTATQRSDYTAANGTLVFAPGEIYKSFTVFLTNNAYLDGTRYFNVMLSNPTFAYLQEQWKTTQITIVDDDFASPTTNPIDDPARFVSQQYLDLLNRLPDTGGFNYWTNEITRCGTDVSCIQNKRVAVADAFFFEQEFQQTGAYIYRLFKAALGRRPDYAEFINDRGRVVAGTGLDQSKTDYALNFVQRTSFLSLYPHTQTANQFLDALLSSIQLNSGVDLSAQRSSLLALYDGTDEGRAAILRQVAESTAFIDGEYNRSFVTMEYFGYLRRDPEQAGFDFWLSQVNRFPLRSVGIQQAMACSFITSAEYQLRFSPLVTHTNRECPQ